MKTSSKATVSSFLLLASLLLFQCKEGGIMPAKKTKLYGIWEMTSYKINNVEVIYSEKFINNGMTLSKGNYSEPTVYAYRRIISFEDSTNHIPNEAHFHEEIFDYELHFDRISYIFNSTYIDPWFYRTSNSIYADTLGSWDVKKFNKKILVLENTNYPRVNDIKITYEKTKEAN